MLIPVTVTGIRNSATTLPFDRGVVMKRKPRQYSRDKRKEQVMGQFGIWRANGDTESKTMPRIAKALDLVPSYKVTQLLLEMETEGKLSVEVRDQSGRWTTRFFNITPAFEHYHEKYARRVIKVNKRGQAVGQMELFS